MSDYEIHAHIFGGYSENIKKDLETFFSEENITRDEVINEIQDAASVIYWGQVMDGQTNDY